MAGKADVGIEFEAVALDGWSCVNEFEYAFVFYLHKWYLICINYVS